MRDTPPNQRLERGGCQGDSEPPFDGKRTVEWMALWFDFLMNLALDVGEVVSMGEAPLGKRRVVSIRCGTFEGPRVRGEVLRVAGAGGDDSFAW